eukprot:6193524-Pleurochrysis_carterae.AAC.2
MLNGHCVLLNALLNGENGCTRCINAMKVAKNNICKAHLSEAGACKCSSAHHDVWCITAMHCMRFTPAYCPLCESSSLTATSQPSESLLTELLSFSESYCAIRRLVPSSQLHQRLQRAS